LTDFDNDFLAMVNSPSTFQQDKKLFDLLVI
jgi:hypothetical protein